MLGTHSEPCRGQMSHICDISPLRVNVIRSEIICNVILAVKTVLPKYHNLYILDSTLSLCIIISKSLKEIIMQSVNLPETNYGHLLITVLFAPRCL